MGLAINWQLQSNIRTNLTHTIFTYLKVIPMTMSLLLLLQNEIRVEIYIKKWWITKDQLQVTFICTLMLF